jgi:hypothetical protein
VSDDHLKVPIDALFFTRLSGELCTQAGKAKMAGRDEACAILVGMSNAILDTLTGLGDELRESKAPGGAK